MILLRKRHKGQNEHGSLPGSFAFDHEAFGRHSQIRHSPTFDHRHALGATHIFSKLTSVEEVKIYNAMKKAPPVL